MKFVRREDDRLLTGRGRFTDDIEAPNQVHIRFVRSQVAHGRLEYIDVERARSLPGVVAVWTGPDIIDHVRPLGPSKADGGVFEDPLFAVLGPDAGFIRHAQRPILAVDTVRYVGEPIVAIAACDPYVAEDAASLVDVVIDELPHSVTRLLHWPMVQCVSTTGRTTSVWISRCRQATSMPFLQRLRTARGVRCTRPGCRAARSRGGGWLQFLMKSEAVPPSIPPPRSLTWSVMR